MCTLDNPLEKARLGLFGCTGLEDHSRDGVAAPDKRGVERVEIVECKGVDERPDRIGDAGVAGSRTDVPVVPAVVAASENGLPTGACAGEPDGSARDVGTRLAETDALDPGDEFDDPLCHL